MEVFHRAFKGKIESYELRFSPVPGSDDLSIVCMTDALQRLFDSIVFFRMSPSGAVTALMVLKLNGLVENNQYVYSVGYSVNKELRGQGVATSIVKQAKIHVRKFLDYFGPFYDEGPNESNQYVLESVVAAGNEVSNRIALTHLHSGGSVSTGREARTNVFSNVYRLVL
jgi:hypothetical protein